MKHFRSNRTHTYTFGTYSLKKTSILNWMGIRLILKEVRWRQSIALGALIGIILGQFMGAYIPQPKIIEVAHAEETLHHSGPVVLIEIKYNWTHERIDQEIETQAKKYGAPAEIMKKLVQCESGYVIDVQSHHMLSYGRERSFGLAQIHLPDHPEITEDQAKDPIFALDYMAKHLANHTDRWTCQHKI